MAVSGETAIKDSHNTLSTLDPDCAAQDSGTQSFNQEIDGVERRRTIVERSLGPLTVNGIRHSMLTLCSTALGGGVLSISFVMQTAGLGLGIFMIVLGSLLAFLSTVALMRMASETGHSTYAGLFSHCAGRLAGPTLDVMLFIYGNGACVGYLTFLGDFIPSLVSLGGGSVPAWLASRELAIVAASCVLLPLALQRDIAVLRFIAPISIAALMYMALAVAVQSPSLYQDHAGHAGYGEIRWVIPTIHITDAFAICVFAFNCHLNVLPVAGSMVRPSKARIVKISARVNLVQMCFYLLIGVTGYISFLNQTPGDIIKAYDTRNVAVVIGRVMLSGTMLVAIPLNLNPTVRSGLQVLEHLRSQTPREQPFLTPTAAHEASATSVEGEHCCQGVRVMLTVACLFVEAVLAILVPGVADVIGLLGATVATAMMMTIPAYCMGVAMNMTPWRRVQQVLLYTCSLVSLASVPVKILTWTKIIQ